MRSPFVMLLFLCACTVPLAQDINVEAVRLADYLTEQDWDANQRTFHSFVTTMQGQFENAGAPRKAALAMGDALKREYSKNNASIVMAISLSANFSEDEIRELAKFYKTPLGAKLRRYQSNLASDAATTTASKRYIIKPACENVRKSLSSQEMSKLDQFCQ